MGRSPSPKVADQSVSRRRAYYLAHLCVLEGISNIPVKMIPNEQILLNRTYPNIKEISLNRRKWSDIRWWTADRTAGDVESDENDKPMPWLLEAGLGFQKADAGACPGRFCKTSIAWLQKAYLSRMSDEDQWRIPDPSGFTIRSAFQERCFSLFPAERQSVSEKRPHPLHLQTVHHRDLVLSHFPQ